MITIAVQYHAPGHRHHLPMKSDDPWMQVRFIIGEKLKQVLDLEPSTLIEYKHHQVAIQDHSTFRCLTVRFSVIVSSCNRVCVCMSE